MHTDCSQCTRQTFSRHRTVSAFFKCILHMGVDFTLTRSINVKISIDIDSKFGIDINQTQRQTIVEFNFEHFIL